MYVTFMYKYIPRLIQLAKQWTLEHTSYKCLILECMYVCMYFTFIYIYIYIYIYIHTNVDSTHITVDTKTYFILLLNFDVHILNITHSNSTY